jgi:hypothetical protein
MVAGLLRLCEIRWLGCEAWPAAAEEERRVSGLCCVEELRG